MNVEMKNRDTLQPPEQIRSMFNEIAPTYDLLNHLLSFGLDIRWRRKAVAMLAEKKGGDILDIAAGSGDFSLEMLKLQPNIVVASDFAKNMLNVFKKKLSAKRGIDYIKLVSCDALALPFHDESFDAIIVGFGIRNFADRLLSLKEMARVLKPGGVSVILELSQPEGIAVSRLYNIYARWIVPLMGKIVSRNSFAYEYLPESIANFPGRIEFLSMMDRAGFSLPQAHSLTFGVATMYIGRKI